MPLLGHSTVHYIEDTSRWVVHLMHFVMGMAGWEVGEVVREDIMM